MSKVKTVELAILMAEDFHQLGAEKFREKWKNEKGWDISEKELKDIKTILNRYNHLELSDDYVIKEMFYDYSVS